MSFYEITAGVVVCGPSSWEVIRDESTGEHWCFCCRKRREFHFIVGHDPGPEGGWYGPSGWVECTVCETVDGDCFPGFSRQGGEDW